MAKDVFGGCFDARGFHGSDMKEKPWRSDERAGVIKHALGEVRESSGESTSSKNDFDEGQ